MNRKATLKTNKIVKHFSPWCVYGFLWHHTGHSRDGPVNVFLTKQHKVLDWTQTSMTISSYERKKVDEKKKVKFIKKLLLRILSPSHHASLSTSIVTCHCSLLTSLSLHSCSSTFFMTNFLGTNFQQILRLLCVVWEKATTRMKGSCSLEIVWATTDYDDLDLNNARESWHSNRIPKRNSYKVKEGEEELYLPSAIKFSSHSDVIRLRL